MIWLDNSRIFAIYAVVFLHVAAGVVTGNDIGSEYWWFGNIYDSIVRWCVPAFVMISGALLLDSNKKEGLLTFYRKRLSKVLLPILFWSFFFLCWTFLKGVLKGNEPTVVELLKKLLSGKPHYHMWFLYMLLSLYLFTPFFRKIVAHSTKEELIFLVVVLFVFAAVNSAYGKFYSGGSKLFVNWFLSYTPYFFLGYLIRQDNTHPSKVTLLVIFTLSFVFTFLGCYFVGIKSDLTKGLYFYGYLSITVIPMSISIMFFLKKLTSPIFNKDFTKKLSILTLGIYLVHPIILELINYKGFGAMLFNPMISIPAIATFVFVTSLVWAWVIYQVPYLRRTI